jgi:RNA exonuclease 1
MIDWGEPKKGPGGGSTFPIGCHSDEEVMAGVIRAVKGDPDGKEIPGGGVDFVWGRFRELEALKGWWNNNKQVAAEAAIAETAVPPANGTSISEEPKPAVQAVNAPAVETTASDQPSEPATASASTLPSCISIDATKFIHTATAELTNRIAQIYEQLPPCTAFIVYSGSGDPREMSRLQAMQTQFKREYKVKKWDQLSVKWTDTEEQALKRAVRMARDGIAFIGMK